MLMEREGTNGLCKRENQLILTWQERDPTVSKTHVSTRNWCLRGGGREEEEGGEDEWGG
jgi:hypothetical protein